MTILHDTRARSGAAPRIFLAWWAGWTIFVLLRYFTRGWHTLLYQPSTLISIASRAAHDIAGCAVLGSAALLLGLIISRIGRAARKRRPQPSTLTMFCAGACTFPWFASHDRFAARLSNIQLPGLPVFGEAFGRAINAAVGATLVSLAAVALGNIIVSALRLRTASWPERAIVSTTVGFGAISFASFALAAAGLYGRASVAIVISACLMSGAVSAWMVGHREPPSAAEGMGPATDRPSSTDAAWVVLALVAGSFALVAAMAPEIEFDAAWYHLYLPLRWLDAGRPVDLIQEFPSLYPLTWELVFGAAMVMGGTVAAKLLHALCLGLLAALTGMACRRWWPASSPYAAVGLLMTIPTVLWEAGTAYIDLALGLFAGIACYALARFAESGSRPWLLVAALEFGLAAATKHLGIVILAIAVTTYGVTVWWRGGVTRQTIAALALALAIALLVPLPWYVRSWQRSGNPFFPELYGVFGGGPAERWDAAANNGLARFKAHFGRQDGVRSVVLLPWDATMHSALFGGALGPMWLILLPALIASGRTTRSTRMIAAGTAAYVAVWGSPISSYQMRFLVPITPALALLGADAWQRVTTAARRVSCRSDRAVRGMLLALACLNLPPFTGLHEADRVGWSGFLTHVLRNSPLAVVTGRESEHRYLSRTVPSYAAWQYANAHLPADAVVLTFSGGDQLYSRRTRIPHDSVLGRPAVWTARGADEVRTALQRLGVTDVLFDLRGLPKLQKDGSPIASPAVQQACRTEYEDLAYRLCRMDFNRLTAGAER
jgi:hypothetical protein